MHILEPHRLEEIEVVHRQIRHMAYPARIVGAAEARMVRHDERIIGSERVEERQPGADAAGAVQEQHGLPFAGAMESYLEVADRDGRNI